MATYTSPYNDVHLPKDNESLYEVLERQLDLHRDKTAVIEEVTGKTYTYLELKTLIQKAACGLHAHGLRRGDIIVISSHNCFDHYLVELGVFALGATVSFKSPKSTQHEMRSFLENNKQVIRFIFVNEQSYSNIHDVAKDMDDIKIFTFDVINGVTPVADLLQTEPDNFYSICANVRGDDAATVFFSSGSTGVPKGIVISQYAVAANVIQLVESKICPQKVTLGVGPFFHVSSLFIVRLPAIFTGATNIIIPHYNDVKIILKLIEKYQVTELFCAPAVIIALLRGEANLESYDLSSLKLLITGGVATHPVLVAEFYEKLPHVHLSQVYGMTEVGVASVQPLDYKDTDGRTVLLPHFEAKVVDPETGDTLESNCRGELLFKTPSVMSAYLNNPEEFKRSFTKDGWYKTGDAATVDEHGRIQILDRIKNMIKVYNRKDLLSNQVLPTEIEALLVSHSDIVDAVVVGIPDPDAPNYDLPRAFVILKNGAQLSEDDVKNFVKERLSSIKWLTGGVVFLDAFPRSALGKVLRHKLKSGDF